MKIKTTNFYTRKETWKYSLLVVSIITILAFLFFTNELIRSLNKSSEDLSNSAINLNHAAESLSKSTESLSNEMKPIEDYIIMLEDQEKSTNEYLKVKKWADAIKIVSSAEWDNISQNFRESLLNTIRENHSIPIIHVDECDSILHTRNLIIPQSISASDSAKFIREKLNQMKAFDPIKILLPNSDNNIIDTQKVYYEVSKELYEANQMKMIINSISQDQTVSKHSRKMSKQSQKSSSDSEESLRKLKTYTILQIIFIIFFAFLAYLIFNRSRKSESDLIWTGMAKETAHQIATPLSSLIAWMEILKNKDENKEIVFEIEKDLNRLETITDRFSKIGSKPELKSEKIDEVLLESLNYMKKRFSKNINFIEEIPVFSCKIKINKVLFIWVIENLYKNSIDAMKGLGKISIKASENQHNIEILISDTGPGIDKNIIKAIFLPGITSKKRGWGLGLSLSKRIINDYHKGQIFVKESNKNNGTTFCIRMPKNI